jgi:hypothetical protein
MKTFRKWKKHKNKTRKKKHKNKRLKGGVIIRHNNGSQSARGNNGSQSARGNNGSQSARRNNVSQSARRNSRFARQQIALAKHKREIRDGWRHAIKNSDDMRCNDAAIKSFKTEYEEYKDKVHPEKEWNKILDDFVTSCEELSHLKDMSLQEFEKKLKRKTLLNPDVSKSPTTSPRSPLSPLYSDTFKPWTL